jgi:hypothetical protein
VASQNGDIVGADLVTAPWLGLPTFGLTAVLVGVMLARR